MLVDAVERFVARALRPMVRRVNFSLGVGGATRRGHFTSNSLSKPRFRLREQRRYHSVEMKPIELIGAPRFAVISMVDFAGLQRCEREPAASGVDDEFEATYVTAIDLSGSRFVLAF
jgi:hypothetical protein